MVKKIRLVDDAPEDKEVSESSPTDLSELAKSMDWKLWEILQTMQRIEKKLTVMDDEPES